MPDATHLLFERRFEGEPLFKSQLDLVHQLLSHPNSKYFIDQQNVEEYSRALNRLKAYVSQLLSSNINRNITEDFKQSVLTLLKIRVKESSHVERMFHELISALKEKNSSATKPDAKKYFIDQIYADLATSNYVAVITSKPLEITTDLESKSFSFQKYFVYDILESFIKPGKDFKSYRFNFPLIQFGQVFWKELKKLIRLFIISNQKNSDLHLGLYENYFISSEILKPLQSAVQISNEDLERIVEEILNYLNHRNRYILVFIVQLPIYSMPIIALDPDDPVRSKIYAVFDAGQNTSIHKYAKDDYLLWRIFVWDKLKTESKEISPLKYAPRFFE